MPLGRPTKYKPEYCQQIIDFMADGSSATEFAASINVSKHSIYEWTRQYKDFSDAFNVARTKSEAWWTKTGKKGLFMGGKDDPFQTNLYNFTMAARFGWSQKKEVEQTSKIEVVVSDEDTQL